MTDPAAIFINVLEVDPEQQQELIELVTEGIDEVIRHRPGFVAAMVFASLDGSRVVSCAQWRSAQDAKTTQADPAAADYARRLAAIAAPSPALYRIVADVR